VNKGNASINVSQILKKSKKYKTRTVKL